ncbi:hypothetical protein NMY22_g15936 [Coprinellus aureogranulatus]|nr:hypothetical protein NMY22_g15936 [Coprinellus aureogranulatus]
MNISLLLCEPIGTPCFAETVASYTADSMDVDFALETPNQEVERVYSYGSGFIDPRLLESDSSNAEMVPFEADTSQTGNLRSLSPSLGVDDSDASDGGYDDPMVAVPSLQSGRLSSSESDELPRTPQSGMSIFLAIQPEGTPRIGETPMSPLQGKHQCADNHNHQMQTFFSPPCSPPYCPGSDDDLDDTFIAMQLVPGDHSSIGDDSEGYMTPMSDVPTFHPVAEESSDEGSDYEPICDLDAPYVPQSPRLVDLEDDEGTGHVSTPSVSAYHVQFDGDSTGFLKWLDIVVLSHGSGTMPSSINGLELTPGDQEMISQWLTQYRLWKESVQCPNPPPPDTIPDSNRWENVKPFPPSNPTADSASEVDIDEMRAYEPEWRDTQPCLRNYDWTACEDPEPVILDEKSLLLTRILRKCETEGVELSEALWLFQGRMLGIRAKWMPPLVQPSAEILVIPCTYAID